MIRITKKIVDQNIAKSMQTFYNKRINLCTQINADCSVGTLRVKSFYEDRHVFVTGATGFLGKSIVEKLLRSCPGIKNIYVLVRSKNGEKCEKRLHELTNSQVFDRLKKENPSAMTKVIGVHGDVELPRLGMNDRDYKLLIDNVSLVFHSAANLSLESMNVINFKKIVRINLGGTKNVLDLCHQMPNMKALVYVSTAFSNLYSPNVIKEMIYPMKETPHQVLEVLNNENELKALVHRLQKQHPMTYLYAKKLAENFVLKESKGLTVAIFRPSLIGAAWKEPMEGWLDSATSVNAVMLGIGQGSLRVLYCSPKAPIDIVPVDVSSNCAISSAWYTSTYKPNIISVFNYTSGAVNPILHTEFKDLVLSNTKNNPYNEIFMYPKLKLAKTTMQFEVWSVFVHYLPALFADTISWIKGNKPELLRKQLKNRKFLRSLGTVRNEGLRCDNRKTYEMWDAMNEAEKLEFDFDLRNLQWPEYIKNNCMGLKTFCLKEDIESLSTARGNMKKKHIGYKLMQLTAIATICSSFGSIYFFL